MVICQINTSSTVVYSTVGSDSQKEIQNAPMKLFIIIEIFGFGFSDLIGFNRLGNNLRRYHFRRFQPAKSDESIKIIAEYLSNQNRYNSVSEEVYNALKGTFDDQVRKFKKKPKQRNIRLSKYLKKMGK